MKEGTLFFRDGAAGTNSGLLMPASNFLGVRLSAANRAQFEFRATSGAAKRTNAQVDFTGSFEELCKAVAGALNGNTMTIVADDRTGTYLSFAGGVCTSTNGIDDLTGS
tara:strand:+ start:55 stop:381 length:327 start_codon:yes stop_codon:yes gene_type:complete